jgi:transcriptional regulator with GAF, ATPase, and Fis domain
VQRRLPRPGRPVRGLRHRRHLGQIIESELFGHVRGAFPGADRDRAGAFEQRAGGTLFLDEIGELDLALSPASSAMLETFERPPIGSADYIRCDVRVIAATNRD